MKFGVSALVIILDFLSKYFVLAFSDANPHPIMGNYLSIHLLLNAGAAFSFAPSATYFFTFLSIAAVVAAIFFSRNFSSRAWAVVAGLALGGVSGNLLDRLFRAPGKMRGSVVDWIEIPHWPVFNLADASLTFGAVVALILTIKNISPSMRSEFKGGDEDRLHGTHEH